MRVLLVTLFFPPSRRAGTENYTLALAQGLAARGHEAQVVCAGEWSTGDAYFNGARHDRHGGIAVTRLDLNWERAGDPNRVLYDSAAVERWFQGFLSRVEPDLVHVTSLITLGVGVLRAVRSADIPLALTLMDFWFLCPRTILMTGDGALCDGRTTPSACERCLMTSSHAFQRLASWLPTAVPAAAWHAVCRVPPLARARGARGMALNVADRQRAVRQALALPDLILSHSRFVQRTFAGAGLTDRVMHLANGHDLSWRENAPAKQPSPEVRIGYVGQIAEHKGLHTLIDGFRLANLGSRARLEIWGDTSLHRAYADRLRGQTSNDAAIGWRGAFGRADIGRVLAGIDVLVVPSNWHENAPLVIQEAFASGIPVVATNLGGMAEAVTDGVNGLLFARNDAADLAHQLARMVNEPGLRARLAAGTPAVKTIGEEVAELEAAYEAVIARRRPGAAGGAPRAGYTAAGGPAAGPGEKGSATS
jgi:glycosyltransferase involved in cell wall biosynthesis